MQNGENGKFIGKNLCFIVDYYCVSCECAYIDIVIRWKPLYELSLYTLSLSLHTIQTRWCQMYVIP